MGAKAKPRPPLQNRKRIRIPPPKRIRRLTRKLGTKQHGRELDRQHEETRPMNLHQIPEDYKRLFWIGVGRPCPHCNGSSVYDHHKCIRTILKIEKSNSSDRLGVYWCECMTCYSGDLKHYFAINSTQTTCPNCQNKKHPKP